VHAVHVALVEALHQREGALTRVREQHLDSLLVQRVDPSEGRCLVLWCEHLDIRVYAPASVTDVPRLEPKTGRWGSLTVR
jgi:hypothetical protein